MKLDIKDLPRDTKGILSKVRKPLVVLFNKCRTHEYKIKALKELMKAVYNACVEYEKENDKARNDLLAKAKDAGIDLDERKSVPNLKIELEVALSAALAAKASNSAVLAASQTAKTVTDTKTKPQIKKETK